MSLLLTREVPLMNWTLLCQLIVLYFVFSVLGWMMEVTLKYIQYHRFINRGFLIGPYCPIYGSGVVLVTVLVGGLVGRAKFFWRAFSSAADWSTSSAGTWRRRYMPAGGTTARSP